MAGSLMQDMTAPYSAAESFLYDRVIAGAVMGFVEGMTEEFIARIPQGGRLLEVGCGGGQLARELAGRRADVSLCGLDLSREQVARAQKRNARFSDRVRFVQGSALALPFAEGSFDAVVSIASIKHWPDQAKGVSECVRVLAPGGTLLIGEADRGCRLEAARNFVGQWRIPEPLRPLALMMFRTFVAGQAIDADEARALLAAQPLAECQVRRLSDLPVLLMMGQKKKSVSRAKAKTKKTKKKAKRKTRGKARALRK